MFLMKKIQLIVFVAIGLLFTACGKDKGDCLRDDFLGTYVGLSQCERQTAVDATVVITAGAAADELSLDLDGTMVTVKVDGCTFSGEVKAPDVDLNYSGELDANKISIELKGTLAQIELNCKTEGIK